MKYLLQGISNKGWSNGQHEKYTLGGQEYNKVLGLLVLL